MATETTTQADSKPQRDAQGRYLPGNSGGPGNPFGRHLAQARMKFNSLAKPEHIEMVYNAILKSACEGNAASQKLYMQYVFGKPTVMRDPDLSDIEEWQIYTTATNLQNANPHVTASPDHRFGLEIAREMRPVMAEEARKKLLDDFKEDEERDREMQRVEDEYERQQAEAAQAAATQTQIPAPSMDGVAPVLQTLPVGLPTAAAPLGNGVSRDRYPLPNGVFTDREPLNNGKTPGPAVLPNGEIEPDEGRLGGESATE